MIVFITGFAAGFIHVLSGPDHLAAISPLAVRSRVRTWLIGLRWGVGHTSGVAIVALLALGLREMTSLDWISSIGERVVGIVLIGIGLWGFHRAISKTIHTHQHVHDGSEHVHVHVHNPAHVHDDPGTHRHVHAALWVGIIHGLAGSSHLLGILPALALPSRADAVMYLIAFGAGTIGAMVVFASAMGAIALKFEHRASHWYQYLMVAASMVAVGVGSFWLII